MGIAKGKVVSRGARYSPAEVFSLLFDCSEDGKNAAKQLHDCGKINLTLYTTVRYLVPLQVSPEK